MEIDGVGKQFHMAGTLRECMRAVLNYDACMRQLYPWDYTPHVIQRVYDRFNWFSSCSNTKQRIAMIENYFNQHLDRNASRPENVPMKFDEAVKLAKATLELSLIHI